MDPDDLIITATVGAVLLLAVPAYGDNWGADKAQPTVISPTGFDALRQSSSERGSRTC